MPQSPWVAWRNAHRTGKTGISTWRRVTRKLTATAIVTGGHSPDWVNTGLKLLINAALGYIGAIFGNPGLALGIFDSQVEDVVLAFHRVANPIWQAKAGIRGPAFGERFESTGGTGFSLSALQAIRTGFWRSRAFTSYKFTVINGAPVLGRPALRASVTGRWRRSELSTRSTTLSTSPRSNTPTAGHRIRGSPSR